MKKTDYQLIIIGGGPAGLTAGLYAARGRLNTLLIEKGATGGQVLLTDWVDNYPGFYDGITGFELMDKMTAHVDRFGLEKKFAAVTAMDLQGEQKKISLESGEELTAQSVIISTGAKPRKLDVPGEEELQVGAFLTAPPVTPPFIGIRRSPWSGAATLPFRRPCI